MLRDYQRQDLPQMCRIWNAVVAQGNAFPQLEQLDEQSGDVFFSSQSKTRVCIDEDTVLTGLYILHPNNVGRCGHICNASFAVDQKQRGKHIGRALVLDCMQTAKALGFRILQFNAVVKAMLPHGICMRVWDFTLWAPYRAAFYKVMEHTLISCPTIFL